MTTPASPLVSRSASQWRFGSNPAKLLYADNNAGQMNDPSERRSIVNSHRGKSSVVGCHSFVYFIQYPDLQGCMTDSIHPTKTGEPLQKPKGLPMGIAKRVFSRYPIAKQPAIVLSATASESRLPCLVTPTQVAGRKSSPDANRALHCSYDTPCPRPGGQAGGHGQNLTAIYLISW